MDLANIYRKCFDANQSSIAGSLYLQPEANDNLEWLLEAEIITNESVISAISNATINRRGELVVEHIIALSNLDVYEKFLEVWRRINQAAADEFIPKLNKVLKGWGKKRHQLTTASPAPPPTAANQDSARNPPLPSNAGIGLPPPNVDSLDPADHQPLPTDPKGFKWLTPWQKAMNKKRGILMKGFQFERSMFNTLSEKDVITNEILVCIEAEHQPYDKAARLYKLLEDLGPHVIRLFIAILRSNNGTNALAEEVQDTYSTAMQEAMKL